MFILLTPFLTFYWFCEIFLLSSEELEELSSESEEEGTLSPELLLETYLLLLFNLDATVKSDSGAFEVVPGVDLLGPDILLRAFWKKPACFFSSGGKT